MARKGKLIAIEGTDGSGKGTQSRRLVRALRRDKVPVTLISFPQYDRSFFGEAVAAYLRGEYGKAGAVDPHLAALLYAGDRFEARDRILRAIRSGRTVILDRYVRSNKAHQAANLPAGARRGPFLDWIDRLEYGVFKLPRPDFTVTLHVPVRVAVELIGRKAPRAHLRGNARDLHEADLNHLRRAERVYLDLAKNTPPEKGALIRCVTRNRLRQPEEITGAILDALRERRLIPKRPGRGKVRG